MCDFWPYNWLCRRWSYGGYVNLMNQCWLYIGCTTRNLVETNNTTNYFSAVLRVAQITQGPGIWSAQ